MVSRFDMMTASAEADPLTKEAYPDTLSVDYSLFVYKTPPVQFDPDDRFVRKPYLLTYAQYGVTYYDDILLMINNIPHVSQMDRKPYVYLPVESDLRGFIKKQV